MNEFRYDAIVIGARCAGSPTAMLLARKGHRVLVVDRVTFPCDTISTHLVHPPGIAALRRWGLLDRLVATGCPPIGTYAFDFGAFELAGAQGTEEEPVSYAPRRTVLDAILVDAAREAGAEVREGFSVAEILVEDGTVTGIHGRDAEGREVVERARVVVGADGLRSLLARTVGPECYHEKPPLMAGYYTYWSGVPLDRFQTWSRPHRGMAAVPTHDDLTMVITAWPMAEFEEGKKDIEGQYMAVVDLVPEWSEKVRAGTRAETFRGLAVPNYFRKPYGPGWVLVGDAGYNKDFITAMGITDAFRSAEAVADAIHADLSGERSLEEGMAAWQAERDQRALPMYEFTTGLATLEPPPAETRQLLAAASRSQEAMDGFARMNAAVVSPAEWFSEENVERVLAATG